jgi:hypothetical protein
MQDLWYLFYGYFAVAAIMSVALLSCCTISGTIEGLGQYGKS